MNVIFIILVGILMGAIDLGFFLLGYFLGKKRTQESDAIVLDKDNVEVVKDINQWKNYMGG